MFRAPVLKRLRRQYCFAPSTALVPVLPVPAYFLGYVHAYIFGRFVYFVRKFRLWMH